MRAYKTKRRLEDIYLANDAMTRDDLRRVFYAFEKLLVLEKIPIPELMEKGKRVFEADKELYQEKMRWINEFMRSKGFEEDVFRDLEDYWACSDDYDYYYELKSPEQLVEEERARKGEGA